jgi:hypothetical protein
MIQISRAGYLPFHFHPNGKFSTGSTVLYLPVPHAISFVGKPPSLAGLYVVYIAEDPHPLQFPYAYGFLGCWFEGPTPTSPELTCSKAERHSRSSPEAPEGLRGDEL